MQIKDVDAIKVRGDPMVGEAGWNIDRITITNERSGEKKVFPVFTSIERNTEYIFNAKDASVPQKSNEERKCILYFIN